MARLFRLALGNLAVLIGMWMSLLILTALAADIIVYVQDHFDRSDARSELPNYADDRERARQIFADTKRTREEYEPFVVWSRTPMATATVNIGEDGYRIHHAGRDAPADAPVIGVFGGSSTWGTGVDDDSTIPALIDALTTGYQVRNYGQGGHNARQNLAHLVNLIAEHEMPDIVIFYEGSNHVALHCNLGRTRKLNGHALEQKIRRAITERPRGGYLYADVVAPPVDFFRRTFDVKWFSKNQPACQPGAERSEQVAETLVRIWEMARTLVEANGGTFHAFLQPIAYLGSPRLDHLGIEPGDGKAKRTVFPIIQAKAARISEVFTDLTDAYDGDEYIYIDNVHATRNGNEIIARRMVERLGLRAAAASSGWLATPGGLSD